MQLILGNPWGLLGLLGIPTILIIHVLQRQSRRQTCTTLFLLRHLQPESRTGHSWERLRNSLPLWLQLLTVLLLTWLLVDPRWRRTETVQRIAIVIDSSLSMSAFKEKLPSRINQELAPLDGAAATTEWHLLESDVRRPALYSGRDLALAIPELIDWSPRLGSHDLRPALRNARRLVGDDGLVVFVSDQDPSLPAGTRLLNLGSPFANVGFAGLRVIKIGGIPHWEALVRNYGDAPQRRQWHLESSGASSPPTPIELAAQGIQHLRGAFPQNAEEIVLRLEADEFTIDDAMPIVLPRPKPMAIVTGGAANLADFYRRLLNAIPDRAAEIASPHLIIDHHPSDVAALPPFHGIYSMRPSTTSNKVLSGPIVAANHPLVAELSWQSLLLKDDPGMPPGPNDEVLLWQGERPLIYLRNRPGSLEDLVFNFSLERGNALRQPAIVVLMHRFIERRRELLPLPEIRNVEQNQRLSPVIDPTLPNVQLSWRPPDNSPDAAPPELRSVPLSEMGTLRAPVRPGFFSIRQGEQPPILSGAIHFADTREADFAEAGGASDDFNEELATRTERHSRPDPFAPLWLLAAAILPAWCWLIYGRPEDQGAA